MIMLLQAASNLEPAISSNQKYWFKLFHSEYFFQISLGWATGQVSFPLLCQMLDHTGCMCSLLMSEFPFETGRRYVTTHSSMYYLRSYATLLSLRHGFIPTPCRL